MGSGGSKPKNVPKSGAKKSEPATKSDSVSKPVKNEIKVANVPEKAVNNKPAANSTSFQNNNTKSNDNSYSNNKNVSKTQSRTNNKNLGNFESDSDSEEEDISAVLAATKKQVQQQNYLNANKPQEDYPETYAQRLQREQYQQQQQGLIRQKTIYRNPDEWDIDDDEKLKQNETDASFDVGKFKEANVIKPQHQKQLDTDIFSPPPTEQHGTAIIHAPGGRETDMYYTQPPKSRESFPHYDTSEEALLAEIEQEF